MLGPQWEESGTFAAQQSAAAFRNPLMPPQRVASACNTVTALASQHALEVPGRVAILARRNIHADGRPRPHFAESREIVGADRLLEPTHFCSAKAMTELERLGDGIGPVRIHEKLT